MPVWAAPSYKISEKDNRNSLVIPLLLFFDFYDCFFTFWLKSLTDKHEYFLTYNYRGSTVSGNMTYFSRGVIVML